MWQPLLIPSKNVFIGVSLALVAPILTTLLNRSLGALRSGIYGATVTAAGVDIQHLRAAGVTEITRDCNTNPSQLSERITNIQIRAHVLDRLGKLLRICLMLLWQTLKISGMNRSLRCSRVAETVAASDN